MSHAVVSPRGVIFDWDGTLLDSLQPIVHSVVEAAKSQGYADLDANYVRRGIGLGEDEVCAYLFGEGADIDEQAFFDLYRGIYRAAPVVFFQEVEGALTRLQMAGVAVTVATNKFSFIFEPELQGSPFAHLIAHWVCADQSRAKPEPDMLLSMCEAMQLSPQEVVMVGDTVHDAHAAKAAGCLMAGLTCGVGHAHDLLPVSHAVFDHCADFAEALIDGHFDR